MFGLVRTASFPNRNHPEPASAEVDVTPPVLLLPQTMDATVQLYDEIELVAAEVGDPRADPRLSPELPPFDPAVAEQFPHGRFREGHFGPKPSGLVRHAPHPSRFASPLLPQGEKETKREHLQEELPEVTARTLAKAREGPSHPRGWTADGELRPLHCDRDAVWEHDQPDAMRVWKTYGQTE